MKNPYGSGCSKRSTCKTERRVTIHKDGFAAFEEQGVMSEALARRFREEILEIDGTRDMGAAFRAFRGRDPDIAALLRHSGITVAAAGESATGPAAPR